MRFSSVSIIRKGEKSPLLQEIPRPSVPRKGVVSKMDMSSSDKEFALVPPQPDAVERAVTGLLEDPSDDVDPWWQAGLDDALADPCI